jgi:hypothetical protein
LADYSAFSLLQNLPVATDHCSRRTSEPIRVASTVKAPKTTGATNARKKPNGKKSSAKNVDEWVMDYNQPIYDVAPSYDESRITKHASLYQTRKLSSTDKAKKAAATRKTQKRFKRAQARRKKRNNQPYPTHDQRFNHYYALWCNETKKQEKVNNKSHKNFPGSNKFNTVMNYPSSESTSACFITVNVPNINAHNCLFKIETNKEGESPRAQLLPTTIPPIGSARQKKFFERKRTVVNFNHSRTFGTCLTVTPHSPIRSGLHGRIATGSPGFHRQSRATQPSRL